MTMPYQQQYQRNDTAIGLKQSTKIRLEQAIYNKYEKEMDWQPWTGWDDFINWIAEKIEKGKIEIDDLQN